MNENQAKLKILTELRSRLNETCSVNITTCPKKIQIDLHLMYVWECKDCVKMFLDIIDLRECADIMSLDHVKENKYDIGWRVQLNPCPCAIAQDRRFNLTSSEVIQRLEDCIEKLSTE